MNYLSVCSGIEAATVAWRPLGWRAWGLAEIEPFPSAVLAHHYPTVPNLGDMTGFKDWPDATLDLLCGGTPCQSFSNAGLRAGLDDPRGQLMLTFGAIAARYRPRWLVWENVPGVLSSNGGRDFGAFLGLLGFLGYGFAYRVLDAQFVRVDGYGRAVPQRRQRVFVVGCLGDWRSAAAVLLEREGLQGHPAPSRKAGTRPAGCLSPGAHPGGFNGQDAYNDMLAYGGNNTSGPRDVASAHPGACGRMDFETETFVAHTLRADGFDASEDGTGRGTPLVPVHVRPTSPTLDKSKHPATAYSTKLHNTKSNQSGKVYDGYTVGLDRNSPPPALLTAVAVRRLMPVECERLQGFPDGYTAIPWRVKPASECPDGPRYKALGNSWAVNCARWIGRRIALVEQIHAAKRESA